MTLEVLEVARQEFDEAFIYFEQRESGLGEDFRSAIKAQSLKIKHTHGRVAIDSSRHPQMSR